jgi:antirestriction protein
LLAEVGHLARIITVPPEGTSQIFLAICPCLFCWSRLRQQPKLKETTTMTPTIQIYVACLAAYNNGILHGEWIDLNQPLDDVWRTINTMLKTSPIPDAEEWAIHDYEGFESYDLGEYEGIQRTYALAQFILEHGKLGGLLLDFMNGDLNEAENALQNYMGEFRRLADYAEQLTQDTVSIPEHLAYYIDYEAMARDMDMSGDVFTLQTAFEEVHVFLNH